MTSSSAEVLGTTTGPGSTGYVAPVTTIAEWLDYFAVHVFFALIFVVGASLFLYRYVTLFIVGKRTTWDDFLLAFTILAIFTNAIFIIASVVGGIRNLVEDRTIQRLKELAQETQRGGSPVIHAVSILAAATASVAAIYIMFYGFGSVVVADSPEDAESAGYFMVLFSGGYSAYLTARHGLGFGAKTAAPTVTDDKKDKTNENLAQLFNSFSNAQNSAASAPIFGGGGGAAFGGIDLSGLQDSSMSTYAPVQASMSPGVPCAPQPYPMMMMAPQPMMMAAPQAAMPCAPADPNGFYIP